MSNQAKMLRRCPFDIIEMSGFGTSAIYMGKISTEICVENCASLNVLINSLASTVFCADFTHVNPS
jgi:hypothetical protein